MGRLQKGVKDLESWCLNNGEFGEQLKSEWTSLCEDGQQYATDEVTRGSKKKFKWKCSDGHEWYVQVKSRTSSKSGCPYCFKDRQSEIVTKARLSNEKSLKTWCLSSGELGKQLMTEWTGECEDDTHYSINQISFGSNKKFKWKCSKGHEWYAIVNIRTNNKTGCPHCFNTNCSKILSKVRISEKNNLKSRCSANGSFGK